MSEMVERVARAIVGASPNYDPYDKQPDYGKEAALKAARAAIKAMRVPTKAMADAPISHGMSNLQARWAWDIMLNEALK